MPHSRILLNDGTSAVLLNDGISFALLNEVGPAHVAGIELIGTQAISDLRGFGSGRRPKRKSRQVSVVVNGQVRRMFV